MANFLRLLLGGWRLRLLWPFLLLLAAFAVFNEFIIDVGGGAQDPVPAATRQASPRPASILFPDPSRMTLVRVVDVLDGDTIDVRLSDDTIRVRYFGSDSPEVGATCADAATQRNRQLVEDKQVYLLPDVRDKDEGGRLLRYAFTLDGRSVDEVLIFEGLARAWRRDGTYRDQLITLEEAAAAGNLGCLWE